MSKVNEFFYLLKIRTANEVAVAESTQQRAYIFAISIMASLVLISLFGYYYFSRDIVFPLKDIRDKVHQMQSGTYQFNYKPRNDEIGLLMHSFIDMAGIISNTIDELEYTSRTDPLTKINNRTALDEILQQEKYKFDRYHTDCTLILVDIDNFKQINDQYGHIVGDKVIVKIANIMQNNIRNSDIVGRWGGEEFLIICPNTDITQARIVAESIRIKINEFIFSEVSNCSASFGISAFKEVNNTDTTLHEADKALYQAKANGRNIVCQFE